jgi:AhpD family alkylhydroperoxidase
MIRIPPVDPGTATGKAAELLAGVGKALGAVPNLMRTLAHSPAALQAYLAFCAALAGSRLSARLREQLALAVAGANGCEYCAAAHAFLGGRLGVSASEARANLGGAAADPNVEAALEFARQVVAKLVSGSERWMYAYRSPAGGNFAPLGAPAVDRSWIGTETNDGDYEHLQGDVQWLAAWSDNIGDLVAKQLSLGAHPFCTRPRNMVAFLPMDGIDPRADWVAGYWQQVGPLTHGHRTFQLGKRQKMQRAYGRAAVPIIPEGRTVVGR